MSNQWARPNKRIFNNAKVSDHFAIIPTQLAPKNLEGDEAKLYDLVVKRFLAVFFPAAEFLVTTRITPEGLRLLQELDGHVERIERSQIGHMGEAQLRALIELLALARSGA